MPGHPEQSGRDERMHRTLKAETARPAASSFAAQQRACAAFKHEYNHERPHEALGQVCFGPVTLGLLDTRGSIKRNYRNFGLLTRMPDDARKRKPAVRRRMPE